jgi:hypothetical protein
MVKFCSLFTLVSGFVPDLVESDCLWVRDWVRDCLGLELEEVVPCPMMILGDGQGLWVSSVRTRCCRKAAMEGISDRLCAVNIGRDEQENWKTVPDMFWSESKVKRVHKYIQRRPSSSRIKM